MAPSDPNFGAGGSAYDPHEHGEAQGGDPGASGSNGAAATTNGTNGTLTTLGGQLPSVQTLNWSYGPPPRPDILSAKPNPVELLHAMRRRWALALGLGLLVSGLAAGLLWYFVPVRYEAYALLRVGSRPPFVLEHENTAADEFTVFKRTQVQLILSNLVLNGVLREPGINRLQTVRENNDDPVSWLKSNLMIDYPDDAEIMRVALKAKNKNDAIKIINKVVEVYMREIVEREKAVRVENEGKIRTAYERKSTEYKTQYDALQALVKIHNTSGSEEAKLKKLMAMEELNMLAADRSQTRDMLIRNEMQIMLAQLAEDNPGSVRPHSAIVEMELAKDPVIADLTQKLAAYQDHLHQIRGSAVRPQDLAVVNDTQRTIMHLEESIEEHKAERRPQLEQLLSMSGGRRNDPNALSLEHLKKQHEYLAQKLQAADEAVKKMTDDVAGLEKFSAQVAAKQEELDALRALTMKLRGQLDSISVERLAPDRITRSKRPYSTIVAATACASTCPSRL